MKGIKEKMSEEECVIGIWNEYESYDMITFEELKNKVKEYNENQDLFRRTWKDDRYKNKSLLDFLDRRKSGCFTQFNNCPWCGEKIDWKEFRNKVKGELNA